MNRGLALAALALACSAPSPTDPTTSLLPTSEGTFTITGTLSQRGERRVVGETPRLWDALRSDAPAGLAEHYRPEAVELVIIASHWDYLGMLPGGRHAVSLHPDAHDFDHAVGLSAACYHARDVARLIPTDSDCSSIGRLWAWADL